MEAAVSLAGKVVVFVLKEVAKPTLQKCGEHLGDALGTVLGRKIDPEHGKTPEKEESK